MLIVLSWTNNIFEGHFKYNVDMDKEDKVKEQIKTGKEELEKEKITFLYKAIKDSQETIRLA